MINTNNILYGFFLFLMTITCSIHAQEISNLADIRPVEIKAMGEGNTTGLSESEQKARNVLSECWTAHGWDTSKTKTVSAVYVDDWSVGPKALQQFNNWPHTTQELQHDFISFKLGHSKVKLLNGPSKNEVWGVDGKVPYKIIDGTLHKIKDSNMYPALVGKEYFIQLPYWIKKVPITAYVKDTIVDTKRYHLVFGTWKTLEPNKDFDQYVYWINADTKLLEIVQYTIRAVDPKAVGFVVFDDFRSVEGVQIPFVHRLGYLPTKEGIIHEMRFHSIVLNPDTLKEEDLRPVK